LLSGASVGGDPGVACYLGKLFSDSADLLVRRWALSRVRVLAGRLRERVVALSVVGDSKWLNVVQGGG